MKRCIECGATAMKTQLETRPYDELSGLNITLHNIPVSTCQECGAEYVGIPRQGQLERQIAKTIAHQAARLTPPEFRYLRKYLGLSGRDLARRFDVEPETVSRWENAKRKIPGPADVLVRLMALLVDPVAEYPLPETLTDQAEHPGMALELGDEWHPRVAA